MLKMLTKAEQLRSLAKRKMFGGFWEALTNQGWPRAGNSKEWLAELDLTKETGRASFGYNDKVLVAAREPKPKQLMETLNAAMRQAGWSHLSIPSQHLSPYVKPIQHSQMTFQTGVSFPEPSDSTFRFSHIIKCYAIFMLFF